MTYRFETILNIFEMFYSNKQTSFTSLLQVKKFHYFYCKYVKNVQFFSENHKKSPITGFVAQTPTCDVRTRQGRD